jgi:hypothetical protein
MVVLLPSTVKFECNSTISVIGCDRAQPGLIRRLGSGNCFLCPGGNDCDDGQEDSEDDQRGNREPSIMHACSAATVAPRFDSRMMHGLNQGCKRQHEI